MGQKGPPLLRPNVSEPPRLAQLCLGQQENAKRGYYNPDHYSSSNCLCGFMASDPVISPHHLLSGLER